jgi:hypothetical protein
MTTAPVDPNRFCSAVRLLTGFAEIVQARLQTAGVSTGFASQPAHATRSSRFADR